MPVTLGGGSKPSTGSSSNDFKFDWEIAKEKKDKQDIKDKAKVYKILTGALTIGSILALSYFGVHALGFAGVQSFAGSQLIGFSASAITSSIGSYLLLCKGKEWDKGEISDIDKLLIGTLGLLGAGAIGASVAGALGITGTGGSWLLPALGSMLPFGAILAGKALFSKEEEDPEITAEKTLQENQRARLDKDNRLRLEEMKNAETEQKIAEAKLKAEEAKLKAAEAKLKAAEAKEATNTNQTKTRAPPAVPVPGLFKRKTRIAKINNPNETW